MTTTRTRAELARLARDGNADAIDELVQRAVTVTRRPEQQLVTLGVFYGLEQTVRLRAADLFVGHLVRATLGRYADSATTVEGEVLTVAFAAGEPGGLVLRFDEASNRRDRYVNLATVRELRTVGPWAPRPRS